MHLLPAHLLAQVGPSPFFSASAGAYADPRLPWHPEGRLLNMARKILESSLFSAGTRPLGIIALDEVGRGCLAGPVMAAASAWVLDAKLPASLLSPDLQLIPDEVLDAVDDSKKLSAKKRESLFSELQKAFPHLTDSHIVWDGGLSSHRDLTASFVPARVLNGRTQRQAALFEEPAPPPAAPMTCVGLEIGAATAAEVDSNTIWKAVQLAMGRALVVLGAKLRAHGLEETRFVLLVDGTLSIHVPLAFAHAAQVAAPQADGTYVSVGVSSIAAKVMRDAYMVSLAKKWPGYGFEKHKGYGTAAHALALDTLDPTPEHRLTFERKSQG